MKKTSRKNLKPKARKRNDHAAGCRLNDAELARVHADMAALVAGNGIPIAISRYTKHCTLEHGRLHRMEVALKDLIQGVNLELENSDAPPNPFVERLQAILEAK